MDSIRGTYVNAFYEEVPITYGEKAYAFPDMMQKLVNVIDAQTIKLKIGEMFFNLFEGKVKHCRRFIDMQKGIYTTEIQWLSPKGSEIKIYSTTESHVENYENSHDPRVRKGNAKLLIPVQVNIEDGYGQIVCETKRSKLQVATTTTHRADGLVKIENTVEATGLKTIYEGECEGRFIKLTKYIILTDIGRHNDIRGKGKELLQRCVQKSFQEHAIEQETYLKSLWEVANIEIPGDERLQQGLRYNIYQLLQSVGKDKYSNIAAKGLSGEGYEGHYFWDTEIYMLPFFILCNPKLAKQLLVYRYTILDSARKPAKELGHCKGAAYAWRTITGPDEYTAIVNNNYYTNKLGQYNLKWAVKWYNLLKKETPELLKKLCLKINLDKQEIIAFEKAAQTMYLPYDETLKIHEQD